MERPGDLNPRDFADRLVDHWPIVFWAGVVGAVLGLVVSLLLPPKFEASASVGVSIDYGRTPPLELIVEDRALNRAADVLTSIATVEKVSQALIERFGEDSAWSSPQDLQRTLRVDALLAEWKLVVSGGDPQTTADVANVWAEVGLQELEAATDHAWEALRIQSAPIVVACSELLVGAPVESFWQCLAAGPNLTEEQVSRLREEVRLSRGVLPILSFEPLEGAVPPRSPVVWGRSQLIVAGLLAGLLIGALLAGIGALPRQRKRS